MICCTVSVIAEFGWFEQTDASKLNTSTSDTGVLANFFNSLLVRKHGGAAVGPDGKPMGICYLYFAVSVMDDVYYYHRIIYDENFCHLFVLRPPVL